ncbi:TPA: 23S rRNA pseudouridine(955/2504/2580) synthase RluC [Aeromonas salmonicida]|nr:23S rRNA pseudouridine(955/2504/2580) synthase RluC [Aeromonas salmonicida]
MQPRGAGSVKIRAMTQIQQQVQLLTIEAEHEGQRIDNFLKTQLKGVPKSLIYRILRKGEVRVNKKRIKPEYKLCPGDEVRVPPVRVAEKNELPSANLGSIQRLESQILFEDDAMIVLNKPSGMAVHGGSGLSFGVIEGLRALRPDARFLELVHRLDRDTSGVLLVAKKRSALRSLHEQLRVKTMRKQYLALVRGQWQPHVKVVNAPLRKNDLQSGERVVRVSSDGKPSETRFRIARQFTEATLVECSPITGRTHQIRVHTQHAGHPIACDDKYGEAAFDEKMRSQGLKRLFLHAWKLTFTHPVDGREVLIEAPLAPELDNFLNKLARR